jgi:ABC-2 type transport system permease protein
MTGLIVRKEFLERVRDGQLRWTAAAVFLLLAAALAIGIAHTTQARREREAAQRTDRQQWLSQGERNPHSAAHFGVHAFKPRLPLSFIDAGLESYTGAAIWIEAHYQNPLKYRPIEGSTALERFGELTAAAVLQLFLPLLIILLSFAAFTAEREQGTLRQLLSLGVPRGRIVFGKALGVAASLGCLIAPAVAAGVAALALTSEQEILASTFSRLAPMAAAYLLYLALFTVLGIAVSAAMRSSRMALSALLGFWIVSCFLAPRVAADIAERRNPTPAANDFWHAIELETKGADGHSDNDSRILELKRRMLAQYGVKRVEDLPVNFEGLRLQAGEEHGNQVFDAHYGKLWRIYEGQERIHHWAALVSPLIAVRSISMAMAGTDLAHVRDFTIAAEQYRRMLNKSMNLNVANNSRYGSYYYFRGRDLWEETPEFRYTSPDARWALRRQFLPVAILLGWCLAAGMFAYRAGGRIQAA